jgi:3-hydroxyacyl-[acyl-carrier-protein] dehydratase
MLNFEQIKKIVPQRFPFLMLDKVIELKPRKRIVAIKNVTGNEIHFLGHFPGVSIMPGALIAEAIAQASIILFNSGKKNKSKRKSQHYLVGSIKARFLQAVLPGDQLKIEVNLVKEIPQVGTMVRGKVYVEDRVVTEAELVFTVKK